MIVNDYLFHWSSSEFQKKMPFFCLFKESCYGVFQLLQERICRRWSDCHKFKGLVNSQFIVSPVVGFLGTPFSRQVALSPRDYLNLPSLVI